MHARRSLGNSSRYAAFKFCLLTLGRGEGMQPGSPSYLTDPAEQLCGCRERGTITLSPENRSRRSTPTPAPRRSFRSHADAELTAKIYANAPVLIDEGKGTVGNPWGVELRQATVPHDSNDSGLFRTERQLAEAGYVREGTDWVRAGLRPQQGVLAVEGHGCTGSLPLSGGGPGTDRYVPLYEAKMIHQFDHRWAGSVEDGDSAADPDIAEKRDPAFEPVPRYWVPETEVSERLIAKGWTGGWLMGWRDITNATNERTVIATVFPRVGVGNNLPLMFFGVDGSARLQAGLSANLSALSLDYAARHKVGGTHLNFFIYQQLPILAPDIYSEPRLAFVVPKVMELTYTSHALAPFARDLGYDGPPFDWNEKRRAHLRAELDAFYARAYGLTRDELRYILDPADVMGPDYPSETFRVLKAKEVRAHGEYRTRRLVLAAWDRMEASGEFRELGL